MLKVCGLTCIQQYIRDECFDIVERSVTVTVESGLHARPASDLVNIVKKYPGKAELLMGNQIADLKSIIKVMSLGVKSGTEVVIRVMGEDEEQMADDIVEFIRNIKE